MNADHDTPSSADKLAHQLQISYGVPRSEILAAHIDSVYREMPRIDDVADFSTLSKILPAEVNVADRTMPAYAVIVETRSHPKLESVVVNMIETCNIPVQLFHGKSNLSFILSSKIGQWVASGQVVLTRLNTDRLDAKTYNALMLSPLFLKQMIGRHKILVFQTDSLCCLESDYTLQDFLSFDYIGGSWNRSRPVDLVIDGGNGGFSLRDWTVSMNCLSRFPPTLWGGGEDGYYAFHMALIGAKVASAQESAKFATQDFFKFKSFGAHAICNLNKKEQEDFFQYCALAKHMFPNLYAQIA